MLLLLLLGQSSEEESIVLYLLFSDSLVFICGSYFMFYLFMRNNNVQQHTRPDDMNDPVFLASAPSFYVIYYVYTVQGTFTVVKKLRSRIFLKNMAQLVNFLT